MNLNRSHNINRGATSTRIATQQKTPPTSPPTNSPTTRPAAPPFAKLPTTAVILAALLATLLFALLFLSGCKGSLEYSGDKLNGLPHGSGTLTYTSGTIYKGSFKNGLRHGSGLWKHPSGISYNGEWQADAYHNWGKLSIPDYLFYEGDWQEGKKEGRGTQEWADGRRYLGEWQNGRMHGYGVMRYSDGSIYRGQWVEGRREGYGELTTAEGDILTGTWERGKFVYVPVAAIAIDQQELKLTEREEPSPLTVTMLPFDATDPRLEWSSDDPAIAAVDQDGLVTPLSPGETTITVTAIAEELESSLKVTVKPFWVAVQAISIEPDNLIIYLDSRNYQLKAQIKPFNATNKKVVWSSDRPDVAAINPVSGLVTPISPGFAYITAKTADGGFTATCMVHVRLTNIFFNESGGLNN